MIVRRFRRHHPAALLAALALLVRMMVPAGFMPMADERGLPTLAICPGVGPSAMPAAGPMPAMAMSQHKAMSPAAMADPGSHDPERPDHGSDHACPFGMLAAAVDGAGEGVALSFPPVASASLQVAPLFVRPGIGLAAPPPPKTGPPALR